MATLLTLPVDYKNGSKDASLWPGTTTRAKFSKTDRSNIGGNTPTDNGTTLGSSIDGGGSGSIYINSDGFSANVQTKTSTIFYTQHFIGHKNGNTIVKGSSVKSGTMSTWTRDVIGFHCEISRRPTGSGDEADGCGRVDQFRVCMVYADSSSKLRIMEATGPGVKVSSQTYQSDPGNDWQKFSYVLNSSDSSRVISGGWRLYGWLLEFRHKKTCGNKLKNCTGRIRYMRPIVSPTGYSSLGSSYLESMLIYSPDTTLSTAQTSSTAKILQTL